MVWRQKLRTVGVYTVLMIWTLFVGIPIYWLAITAFKSGQDINGGATFLPWVDFQPTLNGFVRVFLSQSGLDREPFLNSIIVSLATATIATIIGSAGGYALARFPFKIGPLRNHHIAFAFLTQRMFPPAVLLIPFLLLYRTLNLLDTLHGLVLAYCAMNIPFVVWIMCDFFRSLPIEIEESAQIDGCNRLGVLFRIAIPLAAPGFVTAFLLVAITSWNEFLLALTFAFIDAVTVPLILSDTGTRSMAVIALSSLVPVIISGLALERYITRGLTFGAVK
jgi:multiple sugar transport system permease protein